MSDSNLDLIVDVQVNRDVQPFNRLDFTSVLFVTNEQVFAERTRQYSRTADLLTDGFSANSVTYKAARSYFSQSPRPRQLTIGRREATQAVLSITAGQIANSTDYTITVGGFTFTTTSAANATGDTATAIQTLLTALETDIDAEVGLAGVVTATISGTGANTILTIVEVTELTLAYDPDLINVAWTLESWANAIANISQEDDNWYAIATYDHTVAGALAIAAEIETLRKIYIVSNSHVDNYGAQAVPAGANDLLGKLNEFDYDRTSFIYSATADDTYIELAWLGDKMTTVPGQTTWDLAGISGVVADKLTRTQINTLTTKKGNYFTTFGGIDYVREGRLVSGEWIDVIRGSDNLALDIQAELARVIASANNSGRKIPLTDVGISILVGAVKSITQGYVARDFLKDQILEIDANGNSYVRDGVTVSSAPVSTLSASDRAERRSPDIQVVADLASAVHHARVLVNLFV